MRTVFLKDYQGYNRERLNREFAVIMTTISQVAQPIPSHPSQPKG